MLATSYHAKLLLWGEHIVIHGAEALATPLPIYSGHWEQQADGDHRRLIPFLNYLQTEGMDKLLDLDGFHKSIEENWVFASDIPGGYGLGSSGALCAAIYDAFALNKIGVDDESRYAELKALLGKMEGYFHGASSGTDPLISYLDQSALLGSSGIRTVDWHIPGSGSEFRFFLLDTGIRRQAGDFIAYFLEKNRQIPFQQQLASTLLPANAAAIQLTLEENYPALMPVFHRISAFQLQDLPGLVPKGFETIWEEGLSGDVFKLKICGAGGGGFILGFTRNFERTRALLPGYSLLLL